MTSVPRSPRVPQRYPGTAHTSVPPFPSPYGGERDGNAQWTPEDSASVPILEATA